MSKSISSDHLRPHPHPPPQSQHNTLYHSHLRLSSAHSQALPSASAASAAAATITTTTNATTSSSCANPTKTMAPHIAHLASDQVHVQTASVVQYHRAPLPAPCTVAITRRTSRPMRHLRHPSNLPLYTSLPESDSSTKSNRRLRDSLRPLFHIFSPSNDSSSSSPSTPEKQQLDDSRKVGSKARILQESSTNTYNYRITASRGSDSSNKSNSSHRQPFPLLKPHQTSNERERPTRYFRREQSRDAILAELTSEGLLGAIKTPKPIPTPMSTITSTKPSTTTTTTTSRTTRKRKDRSGSRSGDEETLVPNLSKPLPPLVPDLRMQTCEERYWAGVADDIARRASMLH